MQKKMLAIFVGMGVMAVCHCAHAVEKVQNPHGDAALCTACHTSAAGGKGAVRFNGNASQLCRSCHDGRHAVREGHPSDLSPGDEIAKRIPSDLPLYDGMLTCLSCHDVVLRCTPEQSASGANRNFLRGVAKVAGVAFCFRCHVEEKYRPFNVHDQLDNGKIKMNTCEWCHIKSPEATIRLKIGEPYALRTSSFILCSSCHNVGMAHPSNSPHLALHVTSDILDYMSAYELQPQMDMSMPALLHYVRAAKRYPRSIPLDADGSIVCYSCHNPHEKGLLPNSNPRSIGAEPKHAGNHRLRARRGDICVACHDEGSSS
jgi:hypothetical protein